MASPHPSKSSVPDLDAVLDQFEDAWQQPSPPSLEQFVRSVGCSRTDVGGTALLVELIKIDLDHRWRRAGVARGPRLEEYVARFPELGPATRLPLDLIRAEYWVRRSLGDGPEVAEYRARFPGQAERLPVLFASLDTEASAAQKHMPKALPVAPVAASVGAFLDLLRTVPLLKDEHLAELFRAEAQGLFPTPRELGRYLLQRNWLTAYQVNELLTGGGRDLLLAKYVLLERLGEGAIGRVFKARHRAMDRLAAVKVIRPELLARPEVVERFYREVEAAGRLSHPNVVMAYDAGPAGRTHFFAMEYIEGIDLDRLVKQAGPLPAAQACAHVRQAAAGLFHAHERGLVHRDVKPANLLLSEQGTLKVLDLGLARLHEALTESRWGQGLTADGAILGTPDYLAPEQADDPHHVDHRADIYSLGCTFYYLLSGRVPFPDCSLVQKLLRIQQTEPPALEGLLPGLPPGVGAIVRRMMAKRPADRYPTMAAVLHDLADDGAPASRAVVATPPVALAAAPVAAPTPWAEPAPSGKDGAGARRPNGRRQRIRWAVLILAAVIGGGVALGFVGSRLRSTDGPPPTVAVADIKPPPTKPPEFKPLLDVPVARGFVGEVSRTECPTALYCVAFTPDSTRAVVGGDGSFLFLDLKTWKVLRQMGRDLGQMRSVAVAPDGQRVAGGGDGCRVWMWEPGNETPVEFTPRPGGVAWGVAFSPNGRQLAACGSDGSVRCWDVARPNDPRTLQAPEAQRSEKAIAFCDQGRGIISAGSFRDTATIRRWDLAGGSASDYPPGKHWYWALAVSADSRRLVVGGLDGAPRLLDLKDGAEHRLRAENDPTIFAAAIAPGGNHALTGGEGGELRLWDLADAKLLHRFSGHPGGVTGVAFSPDGRFALSCGHDKTVRLWSLPEPVWRSVRPTKRAP